MYIVGFLGSPRTKGICSRLMQAALDGAQSNGATVKHFDLIKCNIQHCMGCCKCLFDDPARAIGRCPIKDDMGALLEEYSRADGYVFASPVYDGAVTALMKKYLERKIGLTHRSPDAPATIGAARVPAEFKKKGLLIVTGNCPDEYREVMGDPCFEQMGAHWMIEQVETVEQIYVGGTEVLSEADIENRRQKAFQAGIALVDAVNKET